MFVENDSIPRFHHNTPQPVIINGYGVLMGACGDTCFLQTFHPYGVHSEKSFCMDALSFSTALPVIAST